MADRNTYLKYKRDQRLLVYWIVNSSNRIIETTASKASVAVNTTGQISLATLKSLAQLIVESGKATPQTIFRLFHSIIEARKETHDFFLKLVASNPDPEIQKNNDSHKHWINGLTNAFNALGGNSWLSKQKTNPDEPNEGEAEVIFINAFSTLNMDDSGEKQDEDEEEDEDEAEQATAPAAARSSKKKPVKKGKKGRRGRKPKGKSKTAAPAPAGLDQVPLESYRIIEDSTGIVTDYLMATYSLSQQWVELRHYLQGVWRDVAYKGLNSAVAAALSNIAIGMIKDTQSQIFVDFPGHESFETVMQTITRGDPDKAQGMFALDLHRLTPEGNAEKARTSDLDVREELMIHCYQDLIEFITDYQKTSSGKPTKNMAKQIQTWDPTFDLQRATKEQRLKWRRDYTINWLYDLVNVNASIVVQRRTLRGQNIRLETVDWSVTGPWNVHRRLFGINEFAGDITHFAVQKPGTDIRKRILPHHVFQLQCIVDSLSVSRGWSISALFGHDLRAPGSKFRPRRDVDSFMDRNLQKTVPRYCAGVDLLSQFFEKDAMLHGDPNRHEPMNAMLHELRDDFVNWLGESKYMYGLTTIPPSRFTHVNSNGLWEYSPFLCGAGLMEALELAYGMGLLMWDRVPEPMCIIHLHNMLVQKGYISRPVSLYDTFAVLFKDSFFVDGKAPTSNFDQAFVARVGPTPARRDNFRRRDLGRHVAKTATDIHGLLNSDTNKFFQTKSLLRLYRAADWVPDRIPDRDVPFPSSLSMFRLTNAKQIIDPATGNVTLEDTELVKRARSIGMDDATIIGFSSTLSSMTKQEPLDPRLVESAKAHTPAGYKFAGMAKPPSRRGPQQGNLSTTEYLNTLKLDLVSDICGQTRPVASVNYVTVLVRFMFLFMQVEDELKQRRNSSWVQAYEENSAMMREKRLSLTTLALKEHDEECMQAFADAFQNPRSGFMDHIYWDDLETHGGFGSGDPNPLGPDSCTVM